MKNIVVETVDSHTFLLVDGIPQSVYPPPEGGYWKYMMPDFEPKSVLMLGVGGGTIPRMILSKYPKCKILGIDNSRETIKVAKEKLWLKDLKMELRIGDAFRYVAIDNLLKNDGKFDLILVDVWDGQWFTFKVLSDDFIKRCKEMLNEGGKIYINMPNLDWAAIKNLPGGLKDDIGANMIYRWSKT